MIIKRPLPNLTTNSRLISLLVVFLLAMFTFAGCKKTIAVTSIKLDKTSLTLTEGESANLVATISPSDASVGTYAWSSTDAGVASVNGGVVKAIKAGSATITVTTTDGGKTASCSVTVKSAKVSVTGVALDQVSLELVEGSAATLKATVAPSNATDPSVSWSSSDKSIAMVDSNGGIVALKAGRAIITATTKDGNFTANCAVTVKAATVSVTGVTLDKTSASLIVGQTQQLKATVSPDNATDKSVSWSSSNATIASVDNSGLVTAKKAGSATITVVTTDGSKMATCDFTITQPVSGVSLDNTTLTLTEGDAATLTAAIEPSDASNKEVSWSTSDASIVTVEASASGALTAKVAAVKEGSAKITVTTKDGGKTAECAVTVKKKIFNVTGVSLDKTSASIIVGQTQQLTATVSPDNATDKSVTWSSSNPNVASVDGSGKVTGKASGSATVTVTTTDGGKMATCDFTVTQPVTGVAVDKPTLSMLEGDNATLTATISPADATDKEVSWSTSDASVVTVEASASGAATAKVAAIKEGTAKITVITKDGGKTAVCAVSVSKKIVNVTGVSLDKTVASLIVGQTQQLQATVSPDNATDKSVTWSSSNPNVASVDQTGLVTAKSKGGATITVTTADGSKMATCDVTVTQPVTSVALDSEKASVIIGETLQLTATVAPADATDKSLSWSSSDAGIASVDQNGLVSALKQGDAVITAKSADGPSASCTVSSIIPSIEDNTGIHPEAAYEATSEVRMKIVDNATGKPITFPTLWTSSDESIAKVNTSSNDGSEVIVSCLAPGNATITAKVGKNVLTEALTVGILFPDAAFKAYLIDPNNGIDKNSDGVISLAEAGAATSINCANMKISSMEGLQYFTALTSLNCSNNYLDVLDLTNNQKLTQAYVGNQKDAGGNAHVISVKKGALSDSVFPKLNDASGDNYMVQFNIPATAIALSPKSVKIIEGQTAKMTAELTPANSSSVVNWSFNSDVLTHYGNGSFTANMCSDDQNLHLSPITVTVADNAALTASGSIVVYKMKFVSLADYTTSASSISVSAGDSYNVAFATNSNSGSTGNVASSDILTLGEFSVSSSSTSVATVDKGVQDDIPYIKVKGVAEGNATISVTIGKVTRTFSVAVTKKVIPATSISLSPASVTVIEGQNRSFTATVSPSNATQTGITWSSSYPAITLTNGQGSNPGAFKFNKLSDGTNYTRGIVTAEVTDNAGITTSNNCYIYKMRFCLSTDHSNEVGNGTTLTLKSGTNTFLLFALSSASSLGSNPTIVTNSIIDHNEVKVTSDNSSVAWGYASYDSESPSIQVTASAPGSATITVTIGEVSRTIPVTVVSPATSISLAANKSSILEGQTVKFTATLLPSNTTETVRWQSWGNLTKVSGSFDNPGVFTANKISTSANSVTGSVNAIAGENTSVSANATTTIYRLRFFENIDEYTESDALTVKNGSYKRVNIWAGGSSFATTSLISTDEISITSGNSSVATSSVGTNGSLIVIEVNGHEIGSTTITVKIGSVSRSFAVKVIDPVTSVTISPSSITMIEGQHKTVAASFSPSGTGSNLSWSVQSNSGYLTLSPSGTNNANCTITSNYALADALGNYLTLGVYGTLVNNTSIVGTTSVTLLKMRFCTKTTGGAAEFTSLSYSKGASEYIYLSGTSASKIGYDYASSDLISKSEVSVSSSNINVVTAEMVDAYPVHFYLHCVAKGTATISVKIGSVTRTIPVTVK
jgi:uncharacterized protein YjdB